MLLVQNWVICLVFWTSMCVPRCLHLWELNVNVFCVLLCPISFLTWYCSFSMTNNFSWHLIVAQYSLYTINSLTEGHQACQKKSRGQGLCGVASAQKWRAKCFKYVNLRKAPGPNGYVFRAWTVQIEEVSTTKERGLYICQPFLCDSN